MSTRQELLNDEFVNFITVLLFTKETDTNDTLVAVTNDVKLKDRKLIKIFNSY